MLYTIIYNFMWRDLQLRGAEKEVFAVIYGFWREVRSGLIFQGTIGSGKTTLTYAMYGLYKQLASPVIYTTAYDLHTQFKHYLEKEDSRYEEILRAKYLFLDELGSEPERCQSYGTDYTPVQNLISYRYDRKLPTVVTTNLADDKILDRYGPRRMDRIRCFAEPYFMRKWISSANKLIQRWREIERTLTE